VAERDVSRICQFLSIISSLAALAGPAAADTASEAHELATHLAGMMKQCWFSGDDAFDAYRYAPEVNAGKPRILIVDKKKPHDLPRLVVEPKRAGTADAYGPLLATPIAPRVIADLTRWLKGSSDCT
jgi:hypothetical protein